MKKPFKFPQAILNQIFECSNGYFLVYINDENKFEIAQSLDDPVKKLSMINFLEIYSTAEQQNIRERTNDFLRGGEDSLD